MPQDPEPEPIPAPEYGEEPADVSEDVEEVLPKDGDVGETGEPEAGQPG